MEEQLICLELELESELESECIVEKTDGSCMYLYTDGLQDHGLR